MQQGMGIVSESRGKKKVVATILQLQTSPQRGNIRREIPHNDVCLGDSLQERLKISLAEVRHANDAELPCRHVCYRLRADVKIAVRMQLPLVMS